MESVPKKGSKNAKPHDEKTPHMSADENEEFEPSRKPKARRSKKSTQHNIMTLKRGARTVAVPPQKREV